MTTSRNSAFRTPHSAFTLVELLVVITIIGILAALLLVAATGALKAGNRARIKAEIDNLSQAVETYRNDVGGGSYPPSCMTGAAGNPWNGTRSNADNIYNNTTVLNDLRRHLKKVSPRHREPEKLLDRICGEDETGSGPGAGPGLKGGMSAAEALVFWLGGFSSDPTAPLTGPGGLSYDRSTLGVNGGLEGRSNIGIFDVGRMGPRDDDGNFIGRFLEYDVNGTTWRINFWQYYPPKSTKPYMYFDASRQAPLEQSLSAYDPGDTVDPNAAKDVVYPILQLQPGATVPQYANKDKFQILHAGIDDEWGNMSVFAPRFGGNTPNPSFLSYPTGPFTGEIADTIVNFSTGTLEDAQEQ